MQELVRRQPGLAAVLALVILVGPVAQPAAAQQPRDLPYNPPNPPRILEGVLFNKTQELNQSLSQAEERLGPDPDLRSARQELRAASTFGRSGDLHVLIDRLSNVPVLINKVRWENAGGDQGLHDRAEDLVADTRAENDALHRKLDNVTDTGTDSYLLDELMLGSGLLARSQAYLMTYERFSQQWENGSRDGNVRQGIIAWSTGAAYMADLADRVASDALRSAPEDARGVSVSEPALERVFLDWSRKLENVSISVDERYPRILNENSREHRYLAGLGTLLEWTRKQPIAAGQQRQQMENALTVEDAWSTLNASIHRKDVFDRLEQTPVPTSPIRLGLRGALQEYDTARTDLREDEEQAGIVTGISQGLGWQAYARLAANIHLDLLDEEPIEPLLWLPGDDVGASGEDASADGRDEGVDDGSSIGWLPVGVGALALAVGALTYARVRKEGKR